MRWWSRGGGLVLGQWGFVWCVIGWIVFLCGGEGEVSVMWGMDWGGDLECGWQRD